MKHILQPDHIPTNKFTLVVAGLGTTITFTSVGSFEREIDKVDLPDRTAASGGRTKPIEFEVKVPTHHLIEISEMDRWHEEGQDPVSPTYKKAGTVMMTSISGVQQYVGTLLGLWVSKDSTPELEMNAEGDMSEKTYTLSADDFMPI